MGLAQWLDLIAALLAQVDCATLVLFSLEIDLGGIGFAKHVGKRYLKLWVKPGGPRRCIRRMPKSCSFCGAQAIA